MSQTRLSMQTMAQTAPVPIEEILRLKYGKGLSHWEIGWSCGVSVHANIRAHDRYDRNP